MIRWKRSALARWRRCGRREKIRNFRSHPSREFDHPSLDEFISTLPKGDGFGDNFDFRSDVATRIAFQNINGLPESPTEPKQGQLRDWLREARVDVALLAETNLFWPAIPEGRRWKDRMREVSRTGHYSSVAYNCHSGPCSNCQSLQYGGCVASIFNRVAHGATNSGVDPSGLGRFAWVQIQGKRRIDGADDSEGEIAEARSKDLILVSAYRPNHQGKGMNTVWIQQREFLLRQGRHEDPREAFTNDLIKEVVKWRAMGYEVVIGVDANEDVSRQSPLSFRQRLRIAGIEEAILQRHPHGAPATFQHRSTATPIDGIFASSEVHVLAAGCLGFQEGCPSDHRCLWLDIDLKSTLGGHTPAPKSSPRRLTVRDQRVVDRYISLAENEYLRLNIPARLGSLVESYSTNSNQLSSKQQRAFNFIHQQMYEARRFAERNCRKLRMGGVPYSPASQRLRDLISLFELLRKVNLGERVSSRKIRRLLKKTGESKAWLLSGNEIEERLSDVKKEYRGLKKTGAARQLRSNFIKHRRDWARPRRHSSLQSWSRAERMQRMLQREETRRRKLAQGKGYSGGLRAISVEQRLPDGSERLVTIVTPSVVEEGCMKENQARYDQTRAPFSTPPMRAPLYPLFNGHHARDNTMRLMDGRLPSQQVEPATQAFLDQCRFPANFEPIDLTVSVSDHIEFWSKNPENKGSEPHGLHNGHYKAGIKSDLLAQCDTIMRDLPLQTGFSPLQWQNLMNFSIEKKPGEFRLSKMRTIQMMNSELQANNKKVGQAAMKFAETRQLIPSGQCGARKKHEAMALVISKRCVWDLLRQQRRAAGWISNDAKSCFDRIVHWVGMVALMRLGIPWPAVLMMFATLQLATHRVRTGFGDSVLSFAPPSDIPFQGCGQGNGTGPTIWLAISAILINMMKAAGFGFTCLSALSGLMVLADCLCFMDDLDVIHAAQSVATSGETLFRAVQGAMDLWAGGIRATGGALNPPKCFWWLIDFAWKPSSGTWVFRRKKDFKWDGPEHRWQHGRPSELRGALMTPDLNGQPVPIKHLEPDQAEKTLGVMMSPLDNGSAQYEFLLEKTRTWAHKVQSGRLQKYDVLPMVKTTIMKTIEYPMALTLFSQKQWFNILSPVAMTCLPKAGICRNFSRNMVFAPLRFQGLGLPHPLVTQVMHHLGFLQKHFATSSQSTPYLKAVLEGHRLETGTSFELFQQVYQNTAILTTDTWVKQVWREFDSLEIHVEPDSTDFPMLRQDDVLLMDVFIAALPPQEDLKWLNWCRMYLNVVTVSEIVTADGRAITEQTWNGIRSAPRRSPYQWPRTVRPSNSHWDTWRYWLQKTLIRSSAPDRLLHLQLGPWLDDIQDWQWVYSASRNCLFFREGHGWVASESHESQTLRSSARTFRFAKPSWTKTSPGWTHLPLPADIQ